MSSDNVVRLLLLSAIWGASFLFMRVAAPVLGPGLLIFCRVGLAAAFLLLVALYLGKTLDARRHWRYYGILGLLGSTLPFTLFAFAAKTLSASLLSILNATAPIWGAVVTGIWTRTGIGRRQALGLALGVAGVMVIAGVESLHLPQGAWLAIGAAVLAPLSYGIATNYAQSAGRVEPFANAHGSMWGATVWTLPLLALFPVEVAMPGPAVLGSVLALGILCSGIAFLLYFRLLLDLGPAQTLTVTFLIPVFGILWGALILGEPVGWHTFLGTAIVLAGTWLATSLGPATPCPARG